MTRRRRGKKRTRRAGARPPTAVSSLVEIDRRGSTPRSREIGLAEPPSGYASLARAIESVGPHEYVDEWPPSDGNDWTLLRHAVASGALDVVRALLVVGADPDRSLVPGGLSHGQPEAPGAPLCLAVLRDDVDVVRALLEAGANVRSEKRSGHEALHFACSASVARVLLEAGADPLAETRLGETALDTCRSVGEPERSKIRSLLRDAGWERLQTKEGSSLVLRPRPRLRPGTDLGAIDFMQTHLDGEASWGVVFTQASVAAVTEALERGLEVGPVERSCAGRFVRAGDALFILRLVGTAWTVVFDQLGVLRGYDRSRTTSIAETISLETGQPALAFYRLALERYDAGQLTSAEDWMAEAAAEWEPHETLADVEQDALEDASFHLEQLGILVPPAHYANNAYVARLKLRGVGKELIERLDVVYLPQRFAPSGT